MHYMETQLLMEEAKSKHNISLAPKLSVETICINTNAYKSEQTEYR